MIRELQWEGTSAAVASLSELDRLLDRLSEEARERPFIVTLTAEDESSLAIGLGAEPSVASYISANNDLPYYASAGVEEEQMAGDYRASALISTPPDFDDDDGEFLVFFFGGHWSEFPPRQGIPGAAARAAMRAFFVKPELPRMIRWELA